ncbi:SMI1/KNR4 family protein [Amycolatopsis vastitatis]|uniref:SMI1/KNR4 family protein n=1 Tax=Amycolatopsis vastitatis TaxID=1905142 RepID=A0A229SPD7_9PSEU|nr:SMI1/KNR4 family protein [Amycolatopsis vastitatis]OXM60756.1 SMI1/KNR4 family protein [Amycolatopsis vastitatis]
MVRFDQLKSSFWRDGPGEALTDDALARAERELSVRLPAELAELLRLRDGGTVADGCDAFPTREPTSWSETHVPFDLLHGVGSGAGISLLDSAYLVGEWGLPASIVLLSGDGHTWIGLDYRRSATPAVTWFDADRETELPLAPTFRDFAEGLVPAANFPWA